MSGGAVVSGSGGAEPAKSLWTARRRRLQAALAQRDELFADLYGRALDALDEKPLRPGSLVIAGHCVRDLVNGLPDVLPDVQLVPAFSDMTTPSQELADVWERHEDILGSVDPSAKPDPAAMPGPDVRVTVPGQIVWAARGVVAASRAADLNARRRHSALVLGRVEVRQDPTVRLFRESVAVCERLRHPQRGREIIISSDTLPRLTRSLEIIEAALEGRMGSFFATVEDLMDLLEAANARQEGDPDDRR